MLTYWLLTTTTYGTWLPGDPRGSVTSVRDYRAGDDRAGRRVEHDRYGEAWEPARPGLYRSAQQSLRAPVVRLSAEAARVVCDQLVETAAYRGWDVRGVAVMANHFHLVAGAEVDGVRLQRDFKAYASRALSRRLGPREWGTWFTTGGSRRRLLDDRAVTAAVRYVLERQHAPLALWAPPE